VNQASPIRFREEQRFRTLWLWTVVGLVAALQWWSFYQQIVRGEPWGNKPAPNWMMVLFWLAFGIGLPVLFVVMKLVVTVDDTALDIQFFPFIRRTIPLTDIQSAEARTYAPLREYGGWGIRWGWGAKKAYNVSGHEGVELALSDGGTVLIGSQQPEQLAHAIAQAQGR
jgi:hypothetical protein